MNCDRVPVFKFTRADKQVDEMPLNIFPHVAAFGLDDIVGVMHKVADGQTLTQGVIDPVKAALLKPRKIKGRLSQGLARQGARVDARSAQLLCTLFNECDLAAEICRLRCAFLARRSAPNHDQVIVLHGVLSFAEDLRAIAAPAQHDAARSRSSATRDE